MHAKRMNQNINTMIVMAHIEPEFKQSLKIMAYAKRTVPFVVKKIRMRNTIFVEKGTPQWTA